MVSFPTRGFISSLLGYSTALLTRAKAVPWERLNKNDSMLLVVDMQEGLFNLARDFDPTLYRNSMLAHSSLAKVFDLPVVLTTSAETGMPPFQLCR